MKRDAAFQVVKDFEQALCEYTGAPYAVTVDSCTNAIFLAMKRCRFPTSMAVGIPRHTYIGVPQAIRNAGYTVRYRSIEWKGSYRIKPTNVIDSAKHFSRDMYHHSGYAVCVSFQAGKGLPIGRGGAILHDDAEADEWFRRARLDGRTAGANYADATFQRDGWHMYMTPPDAARGLWLMTYLDDGPDDTWEAYPDLSEATWT